MIRFLEAIRLFKKGKLSNGAIALAVGALMGDDVVALCFIGVFLITDLVISGFASEADAKRQSIKDAQLAKTAKENERLREMIKNESRGISRGRY